MANTSITQQDIKSRLGCVRIIPEFNIAALNQGKDKELLFWYLLRTANVTGSGRIPLLDAEKLFTEVFKCPRRTFYRHLRLGMGKLWEVYENGRAVIKIYAIKEACQWFNTFKLSRYVDVDIETITQYPRKALLWNTGAYRPNYTGRDNNPISRQSLKDVTGIDERSQQRFDDKAETERQETKVKTRDPETFKLYTQKITVKAKNGKQVQIPRQLGNIYISHGIQSCKGQLKKAARTARERQESLLRDEASNKGLMPSKRFYSGFKDWCNKYLKGKATDEDSYYPTRNNKAVYVQCYAN